MHEGPILLTGATGHIGSRLLRELEAGGCTVFERTFAKLEVRFAPAWLSWLPMVWGDDWIIGLAPDAEGRRDQVPNRQHPVGEIPHQTVAAPVPAMAHAASRVVHSRSGAVYLLQPIPHWLRRGDQMSTHRPSSACVTETYR